MGQQQRTHLPRRFIRLRPLFPRRERGATEILAHGHPPQPDADDSERQRMESLASYYPRAEQTGGSPRLLLLPRPPVCQAERFCLPGTGRYAEPGAERHRTEQYLRYPEHPGPPIRRKSDGQVQHQRPLRPAHPQYRFAHPRLLLQPSPAGFAQALQRVGR